MDRNEQEPARVVVVGEAVDDNEALFTGTLADATEYVLRLPDEVRAAVAIVTDGRIYDPREL